MGAYAANLAIELSNASKQNTNKTHLFMPELIERQSVADRTLKN
jgi:LacI family transcriptional regulator